MTGPLSSTTGHCVILRNRRAFLPAFFLPAGAGEIARHTTLGATGRPISRFTVARRLHGYGLFSRRPVRCVPLRLPIGEGVLCGAGNTGIGETMNGDEYSLQMRADSV
ncbi:hypothetical protein TNCV_2791891 [Trichonephila clavipes]|nr:hypothetical protein TNCV_2791891 [Trichonephila clavipes]